MKRFIAFFAERSLIVNIITIGVLFAGIMFMLTARREAFPRIDFDYVVANTVFPGANPEDVEKLISIPIENQLREVDGIEEVWSSSIESRSIVVVKLDPDVKNRDKTINDIKNAIDRVTNLPTDAEKPVVTELSTAQQPVISIALINKKGILNDKDEFELRKYAKMLYDRLLELEGVARIDKQGYRDREMIVEVNPLLLDEYQIAINEIIFALAKQNVSFPGGVIKSPQGEMMIRTMGEVNTPEEIGNVLIRANDVGNWVRIRDVANVRDSFEEETIINKTMGKKSITLTVLKRESADIIGLVDRIFQEIESFKRIMPADLEIVTNNDLSYFVRRRLDVLKGNAVIGFVLVIVTLLVTLGWRISFVTALGLPIAFCGTFIWMAWNGITVNLMSMFGLIVVLGMLVDDAIVVSENVYRHLEEGMGLKEAVINGTSEVIVPVAGTILTTIAAFAPLMFMTGIMGKFMWTLPAVVSVALLCSWAESMLILPAHILDMERLRKSPIIKNADSTPILNFFRERYVRYLTKILHHKYKFSFLVFLFVCLTVGLYIWKVKFILFPASGIEVVVIKAQSPNGTSVQRMSENLALVEQEIIKLPKEELESFTSRAGIMQENPNDPGTKRGSKYGIIMVYLTPEQSRKRTAAEIMDHIREKTKHLKVFENIEYKYQRHGPPVGSPVSVTIKGDDFEVLNKIAREYIAHLQTIKGIKDIKSNYEEGKEEIRISVNQRMAAIAGITALDIATTVRSYFEGAVATTIRRTDEEIDIRVMFPPALRTRVDDLQKVKIANRMGRLVPFSMVTTQTKAKGISIINRHGWRRTVKVTAEIDEQAKGLTSVSINRELMQKFHNIEERYPGYTVSYEGEFKDTKESISNLGRAFVLALIGIYIILVALFRSLIHPLVIMGVIPLTIVGVVWTFFFHGLPISFLALMGLVGLVGVVVNDSIVMVDFIRIARTRGYNSFEATIEAARTRLRPIFLTTITTFFGLLPTAYGIGGNDPFLKPMAISMSWGLAFGTLVTLFGTPVLYNILNDVRRLFFKERMESYEREPLAEKVADTIRSIEASAKEQFPRRK
ncbi:MAG: efflux RND transporter permease subunit [Spirochaetes bacterium]|nr:efflux RND transporter permease subunit [Spirochaetota bacterium]